MRSHEEDLQNEITEKKSEIIRMDSKITELESEIMFIHENHTLVTS